MPHPALRSQEMNNAGCKELTRENVASHLQKYRLQRNRGDMDGLLSQGHAQASTGGHPGPPERQDSDNSAQKPPVKKVCHEGEKATSSEPPKDKDVGKGEASDGEGEGVSAAD